MSQPGLHDDQDTLGALVHRLSEQIPELVRSEMRLARAELSEKGRRAGIGVGMFSAAGPLAFFGAAALVTAAIAALAMDGMRRDVAVMKGDRA